MTTSNLTEVDSFQLLRKALMCDLITYHGFPAPVAGSILNYFDPSHPEYLCHVDIWQKGLCSGVVPDSFPQVPSVVHRRAWGYSSNTILEASADAVGAIHTVAKMFYKWHGVPRKETDWASVKNRLRNPLPICLTDREILWLRKYLSKVQPVDLNEAVGRFGPGVTFEGFDAWQKWSRSGCYIPDVPFNLYRVNPRDPWNPPTFVEREGVTKIAEVPKSIKCNRIVSSEPALFMFAQLAVMDQLYEQIHTYWCDHVTLFDQATHNEALYWPGACSVDLSDASDHIQPDLVEALLPQLWPVLAKVRSSYSLFPDGDLVPLTGTFAPMGSGLCFPVLTLVVLALAALANYYVLGTSCTSKGALYHVYGDDAIVLLKVYDVFVDLLTRAGLVVNSDKSCCTGIYRESCGKELWHNVDVTPTYIRDPLAVCDAAKVEHIASRLEGRFFPETARTVLEEASAVKYTRWNRNLQRQEILVRVSSAKQKLRTLNGWSGLNRWFSIGSQARAWGDRREPGLATEVWTRPAWRFKSSQDYPLLSTWLATRLFA